MQVSFSFYTAKIYKKNLRVDYQFGPRNVLHVLRGWKIWI